MITANKEIIDLLIINFCNNNMEKEPFTLEDYKAILERMKSVGYVNQQDVKEYIIAREKMGLQP
jgi:mannitol/fructose-specific phosphotransferase system IIA component (Ntr-type)